MGYQILFCFVNQGGNVLQTLSGGGRRTYSVCALLLVEDIPKRYGVLQWFARQGGWWLHIPWFPGGSTSPFSGGVMFSGLCSSDFDHGGRLSHPQCVCTASRSGCTETTRSASRWSAQRMRTRRPTSRGTSTRRASRPTTGGTSGKTGPWMYWLVPPSSKQTPSLRISHTCTHP